MQQHHLIPDSYCNPGPVSVFTAKKKKKKRRKAIREAYSKFNHLVSKTFENIQILPIRI